MTEDAFLSGPDPVGKPTWSETHPPSSTSRAAYLTRHTVQSSLWDFVSPAEYLHWWVSAYHYMVNDDNLEVSPRG